MMEFKVGDLVTFKSGNTLKVSKYFIENIEYFDGYEHWQPKVGEWCWFWDDGLTHSRHLMQFHKKYENNGLVSYFGVSSYTKDGNPYTPQYQYCEPFNGTLPSFIKEL